MVSLKRCRRCCYAIRADARRCQFCLAAQVEPLRWRAAVAAVTTVIALATAVLVIAG
ncbi:MAG: hypothetical protein KF773_02675 [Deltaproteobacteria bacterium]|nr:hypothetical protein [Deltaproteobacteria bacterium]MCW5804543.1 hypothetical protein [Deltaproteobacteria bacterium]